MSQDNKHRYKSEIQQMMFVSGETEDPMPETLLLIEDIVRGQVVEIVLKSSQTAYARNSKSISPEDVIFLIRHDKLKVNRLRTYLSWKDVRKNAKDQEEGNIGTGNDLIEESAVSGTQGASGPLSNGAGGSAGLDNKMLKNFKKSNIKLPWELQFMFNEQPIDNSDEVELDDAEKELTIASLKRLKTNDERTKNMTKDEYVHWSECRQASFTFRKLKRFREWCGVSHLTDQRPHDDVIDILGFLTFEMVCSITEELLRVRHLEDQIAKNNVSNVEELKRKRLKHYLFDPPDDSKYPLKAEHIEEAWRRLQRVQFNNKCLGNFRGGRLRTNTNLI